MSSSKYFMFYQFVSMIIIVCLAALVYEKLGRVTSEQAEAIAYGYAIHDCVLTRAAKECRGLRLKERDKPNTGKDAIRWEFTFHNEKFGEESFLTNVSLDAKGARISNATQ